MIALVVLAATKYKKVLRVVVVRRPVVVIQGPNTIISCHTRVTLLFNLTKPSTIQRT